ncbi:MAG: patatin-like phospholipase family protein [Parvibaculaceae bacterium]
MADMGTAVSDRDATPARSENDTPRSLVGLALGAGAARGWSHIGVIERLMEAGIPPDVVSGTSIGALVGGCYAAGRLEELREFALSLTRRRMFSLLDLSWSGAGIITGDRLRGLIEEQFGDMEFSHLRLPFICIATELATGHEIWLRQGELAPAIRASYALPGVFKPVQVNGQWLIDGAVVNPIPVSACRALGARLVIAVNLNNDAFGGTVVQEPTRLLGGPQAAHEPASEPEKRSALRQMIGRSNAPGLTTVLVSAFNISQDRLARSRLAGDPPDILMIPRTADIGLFDFEKAQLAIEAGREAAERVLPDIEFALGVLDRFAAR